MLIAFTLLAVSFSKAQTLYTTTASLVSAVNLAGTNGTGGTFILKDGTYNNATMSFSAIATAANPIIIKAQNIGGVTFTGTSYVSFGYGAAYMTLEGFKFNCTGNVSTLVKFQGNNNIRITRNDFTLTVPDGVTTSTWVLIGGVYNDTTQPYQFLSHHNRIDHNTFHDKGTGGNMIRIDGTNSAQVSQYDQIDHNLFKNNGPRVDNGQETIRMGWSAMSNSSAYTTVENNLFVNCDGDPEIISVKSCDNIIRNNTFLGSYGTLSLRSGRRNLVQGNYFFNNGRPEGLAGDGTTVVRTGGIRIYGVDHVVVNNYFEGLTGTIWDAPITLTQGDAIDNGTNTNLTSHIRAQRVMIANNTLVNNVHGIQIGYRNANGSSAYNTALLGVTLANNIITGNQGSMIEVLDNASISGITFTNNLMYPVSPATLSSGTTTAIAANILDPTLAANAATSTSNYTNWKATAATPSYANPSYANITQVPSITDDIDGQIRTSPNSNVGADHLSTATIQNIPMVEATVGPYAYENIPLALTPVANFNVAGEIKPTTVTTALAWTATVDTTWLSINNASGTGNATINITATANTTGAARSGILTVSGAGVAPVTLAINQDGPTLTLSAVTDFTASGETKNTTVSSNVSWTASINNPSWLSINTTSGTLNGTINITAAANTSTTARTGTLTVIGGGLTKTLSISQDGIPSGAIMINAGVGGFPVTVTATNTQAGANIATNTLDKDVNTRWSDDGNANPYGVLTYDFGSEYTLESIKIATTGTSTKLYFYGIQFSTDGINYTTVSNVQSAYANQNTYATYPFTNVARYVKIIGGGNNSTGFSTVSEVQFFGISAGTLSSNEITIKNAISIYPIPANDHIIIKSMNSLKGKVEIIAMDGRKVLEKKIDNTLEMSLDVSNLVSGTYNLNLYDAASNRILSKKILIVK
ncbi:chondroitinase-B domain-containing protein [Frigoriflavimonas asaccharolytica]|uniref:F5/8 type C domain-containing protein n=1 Tax=Frigoriflavimonas asaccharolytica TaxID=2735899 RepID=A0A8J8G9M3_9FLAO|nr:chondroitinase-B domain-containing protein [Frigoriflavimonas asaccharolytica]NRS91795.1 hypothetical protein [Frigoriflavimonas asaccharolytica]